MNKPGCVVLAAGSAARFGENKLLAAFRGKALIRWALEAVPTDCVGPVAVVTRFPEVEALAAAFGFSVVRNEAPELGISRSVRLGTEALEARCAGLLFLVADQPLLRRETVAALAARFQQDPTRIVVPVAGERMGNPCVFPRSLFPGLKALRGDCGGKQLIRAHPELLCGVPVPPEELLDVDSAADLDRICP